MGDNTLSPHIVLHQAVRFNRNNFVELQLDLLRIVQLFWPEGEPLFNIHPKKLPKLTGLWVHPAGDIRNIFGVNVKDKYALVNAEYESSDIDTTSDSSNHCDIPSGGLCHKSNLNVNYDLGNLSTNSILFPQLISPSEPVKKKTTHGINTTKQGTKPSIGKILSRSRPNAGDHKDAESLRQTQRILIDSVPMMQDFASPSQVAFHKEAKYDIFRMDVTWILALPGANSFFCHKPRKSVAFHGNANPSNEFSSPKLPDRSPVPQDSRFQGNRFSSPVRANPTRLRTQENVSPVRQSLQHQFDTVSADPIDDTSDSRFVDIRENDFDVAMPLSNVGSCFGDPSYSSVKEASITLHSGVSTMDVEKDAIKLENGTKPSLFPDSDTVPNRSNCVNLDHLVSGRKADFASRHSHDVSCDAMNMSHYSAGFNITSDLLCTSAPDALNHPLDSLPVPSNPWSIASPLSQILAPSTSEMENRPKTVPTSQKEQSIASYSRNDLQFIADETHTAENSIISCDDDSQNKVMCEEVNEDAPVDNDYCDVIKESQSKSGINLTDTTSEPIGAFTTNKNSTYAQTSVETYDKGVGTEPDMVRKCGCSARPASSIENLDTSYAFPISTFPYSVYQSLLIPYSPTSVHSAAFQSRPSNTHDVASRHSNSIIFGSNSRQTTKTEPHSGIWLSQHVSKFESLDLKLDGLLRDISHHN